MYDVTIVSAAYDDSKKTWLYTLKDHKLEDIKGTTPEDELG